MNRFDPARRVQILAALVEGNSIRAISRMTGASKTSISKLLIEVGVACAEYQDQAFQNPKLKRIQWDEIRSFVQAKEKNVPADKMGKFGFGSAWRWTAIDAETKLAPSKMVGNRDADLIEPFRIVTEELKCSN